MTSALTSATTGMLAASQRFEASAARTARLGTDLPGADNVDMANEAVEQIQAADAFTANVRVARTAADMSKQLLDILA
jgi:flagellar hook protein FlgE